MTSGYDIRGPLARWGTSTELGIHVVHHPASLETEENTCCGGFHKWGITKMGLYIYILIYIIYIYIMYRKVKRQEFQIKTNMKH